MLSRLARALIRVADSRDGDYKLHLYFLNSSNFPSWIPSEGVPRPLLLQRFDLNDQYQMYLVCLAFLVVAILATMGLRKARAGRVLIAAENNDRAAQSTSVDTTRVKLAGFVVAGIIAGIAGFGLFLAAGFHLIFNG